MLALFLALLCFSRVAADGLSLPTIYQSNMVLQRNVKTTLWGYAAVGDAVSVNSEGALYKTTTDADGTWTVVLPAKEHDKPFEIVISDGSSQIKLENVIRGDVFVCSGQSNMQISVALSLNATAEIAAANYPDMRIFQVANLPEYGNTTTPQKNLTATINWSPVTPTSIPGFSGLCYFFGRELFLTQNIPIGLVQSCWGGTPVQAWMSPDALSKCNASARHDASAMDADVAVNRLRWMSPGSLGGPGSPSVLYNSMIAPLLRMSLTGALWDQGEANANSPTQYICLLSSMIMDWRLRWNSASATPFDPTFPFIYRQLHAYPSGGLLGPMRLDMVGVLNTPNTALFTSYDLGCMNSTAGNIHFQNKEEAGRRASLGMRVLQYKEGIPYTGPIATSTEVVDWGQGSLKYFAAIIKFANVDQSNPLVLKSVQPPYHGIEIESGWGPGLEPNSNWMPVVVNLHGDAAIMINVTLDGSEATKYPLGVRYAYADYPPLGLTDSVGLPAWPFLLQFPNPPKTTKTA